MSKKGLIQLKYFYFLIIGHKFKQCDSSNDHIDNVEQIIIDNKPKKTELCWFIPAKI